MSHVPTLCLLSAGACNHALGYCKEAVQDYQACFMTSDQGLDSEAKGMVYLGFYQKELALHMAANLDRPAAQLCVDRDIDPVFKVVPHVRVCATVIHMHHILMHQAQGKQSTAVQAFWLESRRSGNVSKQTRCSPGVSRRSE